MEIKVCKEFDSFKDDTSIVFEIDKKRFGDHRGYFQEIFKCQNTFEIPWMKDLSWVKQINRSSSIPNVCRGMHAQLGPTCQSKLVECVQGFIFDIIIDARPQSKTFRKTKMFALDGNISNCLFVPQGFLHGFISCRKDLNGNEIQGQNIFQYFVGGSIYDKSTEFSVNIEDALNELKKDDDNRSLIDSMTDDLILSDKDREAMPLDVFFQNVEDEFVMLNKIWYK